MLVMKSCVFMDVIMLLHLSHKSLNFYLLRCLNTSIWPSGPDLITVLQHWRYPLLIPQPLFWLYTLKFENSKHVRLCFRWNVCSMSLLIDMGLNLTVQRLVLSLSAGHYLENWKEFSQDLSHCGHTLANYQVFGSLNAPKARYVSIWSWFRRCSSILN